MDVQLFALESEINYETMDNIVLRNSMSYEDPVLLRDSRVLANVLLRQNDLSPPQIDYFAKVQTEIKPHMRKIVTDWMLEVCEEQQCQSEVFSLAVNYMDRFLSEVNIKKSQFQLLGCVCMFIASKFKETNPLPAENLVVYTDKSVSTLDILQWEMVVLNVLQWDLSAVTSYSILDQLLRTLNFDSFNPETVRKHAETFVALAVTEYGFHGRSPAVVAVACLGAALRGLNSRGLEDMLANMHFKTGVEIDMIRECMDQIEVSIRLSMSGSSYQPGSTPVVPPSQSAPKVIPQKQSDFSSQSASTTPTDLMDVAQCAY